MREYVLITLNMIEYATTYLKNQNAEYAGILTVFDAVRYIDAVGMCLSIRSLYKLLSSYRDRDVFKTMSKI